MTSSKDMRKPLRASLISRLKLADRPQSALGGVTIKISGSGSISEGRLNSSGSCSITGSIKAVSVKSSGSLRIGGDLEAGMFTASGSCRIGGSLSVKEARVSGSCMVGGAVKAETSFKSSGSLSVGGNITAGLLTCSGSVRAESVEARECYLSGSFHFRSVKCYEVFEAKLHGSSTVDGSITAKTVSIKSRRGEGKGLRVVLLGITLIDVSRHGEKGSLSVDTISGEDIYLENVCCRLVKGGRVYVGPGCKIERVEYTESLTVDPESSVNEQIKVS